MGGGSNMTVIQGKFRKAVSPLDGVAETGRRGVPPSVASFISDFPCDAEAQSFETPERFAESFVPVEDQWGLDHPLSRPVCYVLIGLAGFALWSAGAFAWWAVG